MSTEADVRATEDQIHDALDRADAAIDAEHAATTAVPDPPAQADVPSEGKADPDAEWILGDFSETVTHLPIEIYRSLKLVGSLDHEASTSLTSLHELALLFPNASVSSREELRAKMSEEMDLALKDRQECVAETRRLMTILGHHKVRLHEELMKMGWKPPTPEPEFELAPVAEVEPAPASRPGTAKQLQAKAQKVRVQDEGLVQMPTEEEFVQLLRHKKRRGQKWQPSEAVIQEEKDRWLAEHPGYVPPPPPGEKKSKGNKNKGKNDDAKANAKKADEKKGAANEEAKIRIATPASKKKAKAEVAPVTDEEEEEEEDNNLYCLCEQVADGNMVACDNKECPREWFHYACVGLERAPRGKWLCPYCSGKLEFKPKKKTKKRKR